MVLSQSPLKSLLVLNKGVYCLQSSSIFSWQQLFRDGNSVGDGIQFNYRLDGSLFNPRHLKAKSKVTTSSVFELQYATTTTGLQQNLDALAATYCCAGLIINTKKTEVLLSLLTKSPASCQPFFVLGNKINEVETFTYLGSILSFSHDQSFEIQHRIKKASSSFGCLMHQEFLNHILALSTKIGVNKAICISLFIATISKQ